VVSWPAGAGLSADRLLAGRLLAGRPDGAV